jgi:2-succinyl-6-hydroxy-2,4-cyclohexadiene-1-carboxylate synthase
MRLRVNNVCYNIERAGVGAPLVLLHGFTGSAASWTPHISGFSPHLSTIAVDLLGHGESDAPVEPSRYSIENSARDLAAILDELGIQRAHVLGYSMGGRVALFFAYKYPQRVNHLLLESASPGIQNPGERAQRAASDVELAGRIEREGIEPFVEHWTNLPLFASQEHLAPPVREQLKQQRLRNKPLGLANSLRGLSVGVQPSLWDELPTLSAPSLLIAGALDAKYTEIAHSMAHVMPDARVQVVADAGHTVHLERPEQYNALVLEFLKPKNSRLLTSD